MEMLVKREPSNNGATLGKLYMNGKFECYTLEDEIREDDRPVSEWKVQGKTAIPAGTYDVIISMSNRFKKELPEVLKVPGFAGIRIHPGNCAEDTEGCLLVGDQMNEVECKVLKSRDAFNVLFLKLDAEIKAGNKITITYENP